MSSCFRVTTSSSELEMSSCELHRAGFLDKTSRARFAHQRTGDGRVWPLIRAACASGKWRFHRPRLHCDPTFSFAKGDTFTAVKKVGQWYMARDGGGNEGLVPSTFVRAHGSALAETSM